MTPAAAGRPPVKVDVLLDDPAFPRLRKHLVESTGLVYYTGKDADLAQRVMRRLSATATPDCASYLNLLAESARGPAERDALIGEVTIGETYLFRHREHFDALRKVIFPELLSRRRNTARLRIWSAGCSDGAEAYSLAILIRRDMAAEFSGWQVDILGTDINRRAIASAREGEFDEWSFRAESPELRQTCFTRHGARWRILPQFKADVSFEYHNLAEPTIPAAMFDLVICRNVMIYFGPEMMNCLAARFHQALAPGGWLLVGPTEPNMTSFRAFQTVNAPGVTLYQKTDSPSLQSLPLPPPTVFPSRDCEGAVCPSELVSLPAPTPTLDDVRHLAGHGDWEEAERTCRQLLHTDTLNSAVHFYYALILDRLGHRDKAEHSLRRAIYLDRSSILAHYYLGLQLLARDPEQAARCFRNAVDLLTPCDPARTFPDAGGISMQELAYLAQTHLDILRTAPQTAPQTGP